jgi:hypothetical protein
MPIERITLDAIKKLFTDFKVDEDSIKTMLDNLEKKVSNQRFNPHSNNTMMIYNIMDNIQDWQDEMGKIFKEALKYKEASELLAATISSIYDEELKTYLISEELATAIKVNGFKNKEQYEAWSYKKINDSCGIGEYIKFYKDHIIKSDYTLKQVENMSDIIEKQDAKVSRKISIMHEEVGMGVLKGLEVKEQIARMVNNKEQEKI